VRLADRTDRRRTLRALRLTTDAPGAADDDGRGFAWALGGHQRFTVLPSPGIAAPGLPDCAGGL
jgi:hypothetical protein